jgi:anti-anti-sigma factor
MDSSLAVRVFEVDNLTVVGLDGDAVDETSSILEDRLAEVLAQPRTVLVLDCHLLRHLGRTQATVLADLSDQIQAGGGRVVVRQPNPEAHRALDETGLLDRIEIET